MNSDLAPSLSDLIRLLYEAALNERLWSGMADHLAQAFGASSAIVKIDHPDQTSVNILQVTENFAIAASDPAWAEHWHRNDLWVQEVNRRKLKGAVNNDLLISDRELTRTGFYNEWLRPLMIHSVVGAVIPLGPDGAGVIGIHRPQGSAHFAQDDLHKLNTLVPHVQLALRLRRHLHHAHREQLTLEQALAATGLAMVAVDPEATLLFANQWAEALLLTGDPLGVKAGRLCTRTAAGDAELKHHIKVASLNAPSAAPGAMRLGQDGPRTLTLAFVPLVARAHELNAKGPAALVLIRGLNSPTDRAEAALRQLFGLTPSEASVAVKLAQGLALEDIAQVARIGLGTVRTHLKSAMAKTGTHRQSQLVALVWHSVGALPLAAEQPAGR